MVELDQINEAGGLLDSHALLSWLSICPLVTVRLVACMLLACMVGVVVEGSFVTRPPSPLPRRVGLHLCSTCCGTAVLRLVLC